MTGANLGCGTSPTKCWLNFDNSLSVRWSRWKPVLTLLKVLRLSTQESIEFGIDARKNGIQWADACKRIPVPDNSLDVVYSSHVLEHFDSQTAAGFLAEIHRVLKPGGVVRLVVPDLRRRAEQYLKSGDANAFMHSLTMPGYNSRSTTEKLRMLALGDRLHQWMYDARSLEGLLSDARFEAPTEMQPGHTMIPDPGGLDLYERQDESIYVEARKP